MKRKSPSVKKKKAEVQNAGTADVELMHRALDALRLSPTVEMTKRLKVAELLALSKDCDSSAFGEFTLEDLLALGAQEIVRLSRASTNTIRALAERILTISHVPSGAHFDAPSVMPFASSEDSLLPPRPSKLSSESDTFYRSTEAELKFIGLLHLARGNAALSSLLDRTLKEFWDPSWPQAPFEQQLTLRQLLHTDIEALMKKRSFTAPKLHALTALLELLLSRAGELPRSSPPTQASRGNTSDVVLPLSAARPELSAIEQSVLWGFEQFVNSLPATHPMRSVFVPLNDLFEPKELCACLNSSQESALLPLSAQSKQRLRTRLETCAPMLRTSWNALIAGAGTSFRQLASTTGIQAAHSELEYVLVRLVLSALDAQPVTFRGHILPGYWTADTAAFGTLFESLLQRLPLTHAQLVDQARLFFPLFDSADIAKLISKYAKDRDGSWHTI